MLRVQFFSALLILFLVGNASAFAGNDLDSKTILSGVVVDEKGEPLAGVAVRIQGVGQLLYTDFDGKFQTPIKAKEKIQIKLSGTSYELMEMEVNPENFDKPIQIQLKSGSPY